MQRLIFAIVLLFAGSTRAQLVDPSIQLLSDSNNLRLHLQNPDPLFSLAEAEVWNPVTHRYECPLLSLLQSKQLVRPPFTHLRALQKEKSRRFQYPDLVPRTMDTFDRVLNKEPFDSTQISDIIELTYDPSGKLLERVQEHRPTAAFPDLVDRDSIRIHYDSLADGNTRIIINDIHHTSANKGFYTSIYFKEDFSKGPLHLIEHRRLEYLIGKHNELLEYSFQYEVIANGKKGSWTANNTRSFARDSLGRQLRLRDSLTQLQLPLMTRVSNFEEIPKEDWPFRPESIQISRWLKKQPGYKLVRKINKETWLAEDRNHRYIARKTPLQQADTELILYTAKGQQMGTRPASDGASMHLRQDLSDTLGAHYAWYTIDPKGSDHADTAWYKAGSMGEATTLRMGCVVESYFERPKGTLPLLSASVLSKNTIRLKNHSRLITYGKSRGATGDHAYWAPVNYRYEEDSEPDFLLCSPDGRLLYFQDADNLYRIQYLP